jgi:hypothetical protein
MARRAATLKLAYVGSMAKARTLWVIMTITMAMA